MAVKDNTVLKVGIVRDERYLEHKTGHIHPEHPKRLRAIYRMLDQEFPHGLLDIEAELATLEHLELVHTPVYIEKVLKTAEHSTTSLSPDTPVSAKTYLAAWLAVGGCINGLGALLSGKCDLCFALIRPPGHHAMPDRAAGFCIFNNLGVTARFAIRRYGFNRVLILDWDVHHGNGINDIFYEEKSVLYFSTHDTGLFPYTGDWEDTGKGEGEGYTVNLPVPRTLKDSELLHVYRELLGPVVRRYRPDLILGAAGFDGHHQDPIGRSKLTERYFYWLTKLLIDLRREVNHPPMLLALEGGYDSQSLASSVKEVFKSLAKQKYEEPFPSEETEQTAQIVEKARNIHGKFGVWAD